MEEIDTPADQSDVSEPVWFTHRIRPFPAIHLHCHRCSAVRDSGLSPQVQNRADINLLVCGPYFRSLEMLYLRRTGTIRGFVPIIPAIVLLSPEHHPGFRPLFAFQGLRARI